MILPLALMALMVLATQAAALLALGTTDVQIAANHFEATQALFLAEAGIEDAFNTLRTTTALAAAPSSPGLLAGLSGPGPSVALAGTYDVRYQSAGPNTVRVTVTGSSRHGGSRVVRATMTTRFAAAGAVLGNAGLALDGTMSVTGRCGAVHANGALDIGGNYVEIQTGAASAGSATGVYRKPGSGDQTMPASNQPRISAPAVSATRLLSAAQADAAASESLYRLTAAGAVLRWNTATKQFDALEDQTTPSTARTILRGSGPGWEWSRVAADAPAQWRMADSSAPAGTFYVEGDVLVTGDAGNASTLGPPWTATLIAADVQLPGATSRGGNVVVTGNPKIAAHLPDVALAADRDVAITGSPAGTYTGLLLAHESISIAGSASITGALLAEDAESLSAVVTGSRVSGGISIHYDCGAVAPLDGPLMISAWGW